MMVQRLLTFLVNTHMKCAIALDINERKISGNRSNLGRKTIASNSTAVVHPRDLFVKTFYRLAAHENAQRHRQLSCHGRRMTAATP
jgi:hypothetical protein